MDAIFQTGQSGFSFLGLNTPVSRFGTLAALGGALEYTLKPPYSYNSDGSFRPWSAFSDSPNATYLPPGSTAFLFGAIGGLFF